MVEPEILAVVVWSQATRWDREILADVERRFVLRAVFRVSWTPERFASNLSRLYGDTLPSGFEKELHSGTGAFLLAVVEDPSPRYALRRTTRGVARVNTSMFAARRRYRRLTGGGFRVHATLDAAEADRDLYLITGRRRSFYAADDRRSGAVVELSRDLIGTEGWTDEIELLQALEVCGGYVALSGVGDPLQPLVLLSGDKWWAERVAQGTADPAPESSPLVAGRRRRLELREPGDGTLDERWQRLILRDATRDARGVFVPAPEDRVLLEAPPGAAARALAARLGRARRRRRLLRR